MLGGMLTGLYGVQPSLSTPRVATRGVYSQEKSGVGVALDDPDSTMITCWELALLLVSLEPPRFFRWYTTASMLRMELKLNNVAMIPG